MKFICGAMYIRKRHLGIFANLGEAFCKLKSILQTLTNNTFSTKNAYEMSKFLEDLTIPEDFELVSIDVVSLFTKIPVEDTISYIEGLLSEHTTWKQKNKAN